MKNKIRKCPICGNKQHVLLYNQRYTSHFNHKIVSCKNCNFIFVANIPSRKYYEEYYKNESKYEGIKKCEINDDKKIIRLLSFIEKNISKKSKILDIGCSTGYFLSVLKKDGYKNLLGIEPAPKCKEIAKKEYGLKVETVDLKNFYSSKKYDLIIFSMVLEHLIDIKESIKKISDLLNDDGYLYISVPNASNFCSNTIEPFGEFSTEHINFFTESSLYFLMRGFKNVLMKNDGNNLYSVWKKGDSDIKSILKYIDLSKTNLDLMQKMINSLSEKVIVWGAGALSQRLLSTTNIKNKILFFVDSNQNLQGAKLGNIPIYSPNIIIGNKSPILISSFVFKEEIINNIKKLNISNKVITF